MLQDEHEFNGNHVFFKKDRKIFIWTEHAEKYR